MKNIRRIIGSATAGAFIAFALAQNALAQSSDQLQNPLNPQFSTIPGFISGALKVLVEIALPIITVFIVYAGFKFIAARGNPGELEVAKKNFMFVILGALLILGAWVLATLIGGTVTQLVSG